ncbi:hypothetical protein AVEN_124148-1 [Araneus ventricosus]|uniref:Uncharacterized protein n=1 Tax=Araneus ventricosus TaxID=182803 RepID=A0A4Y2N275_ARAVE|nr:hypothetical protein AVEN_124148-1 [Araneus ventricosus]
MYVCMHVRGSAYVAVAVRVALCIVRVRVMCSDNGNSIPGSQSFAFVGRLGINTVRHRIFKTTNLLHSSYKTTYLTQFNPITIAFTLPFLLSKPACF